MSILLTLLSALNEASFERALMDSLNIFQQMWISCRTARISSAWPSGCSKRRVSPALHASASAFTWQTRSWCLRMLHRGTNGQRGWWLRVEGQILESERDVVTVRWQNVILNCLERHERAREEIFKNLRSLRGSVLMCFARCVFLSVLFQSL